MREGTEVCLIGVGKMLEAVCDAADLLAPHGISCSVWDPRVVTPLDQEMNSHAARHRLVVTVEDGLRAGGIGEAIRHRINAVGPTKVETLGIPTAHLPHGKVEEILGRYELDAQGVATLVLEQLNSKTIVHPTP